MREKNGEEKQRTQKARNKKNNTIMGTTWEQFYNGFVEEFQRTFRLLVFRWLKNKEQKKEHISTEV